MRTRLLFIMLFFFLWKAEAQQYTVPQGLVNAFISVGEGQSLEQLTPLESVTISTSLDQDNFYEITLKCQGDPESFKLKPLTFPEFYAKFKTNMYELMSKTKRGNDLIPTKVPSDADVQNHIALLFTQIVTYYNTENERPQVATIFLKQSEIKAFYDLGDDDYEVGVLSNVSVEISFYGGFIEKMQVNAKVGNEDVSFNNKFSIGISATKNIGQLSNNLLYTNEQFYQNQFPNDSLQSTGSPQIKNNKSRNSLYIAVGDVIRYVKKIDVNANDISPVPQLILLDSNQTSSPLYKEESSKLFEAVVYTDFFGVFDEENPNGIIQTEINKRFNIETSRMDTSCKWWAFLFPPIAMAEGIGFFQYFDAHFQYSKIEKTNKFLLPQTFETFDSAGNVTSTEAYYSPISLYQHRSMALGGIFNIMTLENQNAKLNMYLSSGFLFGRSGIKETETDETGSYLNNLEIPIEFKFHLLPEKRVSFIFADKLSWFDTFDSKIPLRSIENNQLTSKNRWLNSFNIDVNVDVSSTGKLFLRYKLIHELDEINTNFSQLQFGYSFYLLQRNGSKKGT